MGDDQGETGPGDCRPRRPRTEKIMSSDKATSPTPQPPRGHTLHLTVHRFGSLDRRGKGSPSVKWFHNKRSESPHHPSSSSSTHLSFSLLPSISKRKRSSANLLLVPITDHSVPADAHHHHTRFPHLSPGHPPLLDSWEQLLLGDVIRELVGSSIHPGERKAVGKGRDALLEA